MTENTHSPGKPTTSARYDQLHFHAAGGLGEVYRATDASLRREVALKFIQEKHSRNPEYLDLFFLEAEITSRLDHPGVVPVYGVGSSEDERPFYAMRYIEGLPLREAIEKFHESGAAPKDLHRLLTHLVAVCNTVAYAHNRGIAHCDIKPDNIMLGKFGETLLVDWGLATSFERDDRARASGEKTMRVQSGSSSGKSSGGAAGTVGYMSPEQHPGFLKPIRPASDIYSLGATLYCMLTNRAPLQGADETLLLDKLRYGEFPRPSEVNPHVPLALEAIAMKAMAPHPADRYPTALELADDLESWLADEPVSVYREPFVERVARWARRNRGLVILGATAVMLGLLLAFAAAIMLSNTAAREKVARVEAEDARKEAELARGNAILAQQNGMRLAARFAAKAVANEIDRRWQILTDEAQKPELQQQMLALQDKVVGSQEQRSLQTWLDACRKSHLPEADSWFLTDAQGVQLARAPFNEKTIFVNFSERTYFHGGPRDLTAEEKSQQVKPITSAHLSAVYLSTASRSLKVAFSVPVWKDNKVEGECLGVLGMSVELGEFSELQTGLDAGQIAVLVDTREDQVDGSAKQGLILHHPTLHEAERRRVAAGDTTMFRIRPELVERLIKLRQLRERDSVGLSEATLSESMDTEYHDPVAHDGSAAVIAAFEPVRVDARPSDVRDTGWVVIVQETPLQTEPDPQK